MTYIGKVVQDYAEELPAGGAMAADTWYYLDIAVAGDNYNATATDLSKIICTTDGYTLTTATTGGVTLVAENNSLSVTRYYVKSVGAANNLVVAPASYTYTVGSATADKTYIQPGNTVTVSYQDLVTSNPGAVLTKDFSGVTFDGDAITVTPTSNGFSFEVPSGLAVGTAFTLAIPANAIGYAVGSTYNEAQNITLTTPAIYDGIYYMYNTYTSSYISRAGAYNTQAVLDNWGLAFKVATDGNNNTQLRYFDSELYLGDDGFCYGDCTDSRIRNFNVTKVAGGYKFLNTNNSKYLAANSGATVADAVEGVNLLGTSNIWSLESTASHVDNYTANANTQSINAATAAGMAGITTKAALDSELATNYVETSITITGSKAEKYQVYPGNKSDSGPVTYYSETVENLEPGLYKLSVDAFQRAASNVKVSAADGARGITYLYAGDAKTQLKSVMDYGANDAYASDYSFGGKHYPNNESSAYTALATGNYSNEVYVYVADGGSGTGSLEIGIKNPSRPGANCGTWTVYDNWTLTYYEPKATASEKTALSDAIAAAEAKTLGFEDGEYAPYNNVDALTKLAAAKAVNPETVSGKNVVAATTALTGTTWTANVAEVNAIYNGDFALSENDGTMDGWKTDHSAGIGGAYHARAFVLTSGQGNYDNLAVFNQGDGTRSCAYFRFDGTNSAKTTIYTYGETVGYTIPLKNTVYRMTAQVGGWGQVDKDVTIQIAKENGDIVKEKTVHTPNVAVSSGGSVVAVNFVFEVEDGNYKVFLKNGSVSADNAIAVSNIELKKAVADVVSINEGVDYTPAASDYADVTLTRTLSNTNWNTFVVPFDIDNATLTAKFGTVEVAEYAEASADAQNATVSFTKMATPAITANTPVLLKTSTAPASVTFNGVQVKTGEAKVAGTNFDFVGSYDASKFVKTGDYYIYQNKIYKSAKDDGTFIKGTRAYIEAKTTGARIVDFTIDGVTSGIRDLNADLSESEGVVYNLNGQKVQSVKNGVFVKNGKKVVVK